MLGAIVGDIIGAVHEGSVLGTKDFTLLSKRSLPTDDSVLTVATAEVLLDGGDYGAAYRRYARRYPGAGFGSGFYDWAFSDGPPARQSLGNGGAMRVSPIGWVKSSLDQVLAEAVTSAAPTHGHPDGVAGAQAIAGAVFLARSGAEKAEIRAFAESSFGYDLSPTPDSIGPSDVRATNSVPHALVAFMWAEDFEDAVRNAVRIGGDSDTVASMAGAVAEAWFGGVPQALATEALARLDDPMREIVHRFVERYPGR